MAKETKRINVVIDGNSKGLRSASKKAKKSMGGLTAAASKLGGAIAGAFAVGAVINFAKASVKAFDVQQKAEAKLLTALKGRADIQKRLIKQAQTLQKTTLFGDEQTIEAQAFLASMSLSEDAIIRLTPLVQDLATKMGGDLKGAADLIAKSVGSSTNALSRYGITISGAVGSTERLESAIKGLNTQVGGQSEAAAKAGIGAITQLGNAFGDLQETIGELIVGDSGGLVKWLTDAVTHMDRLTKSGNFLLFMMNPMIGNLQMLQDEAGKYAKELVDTAKIEKAMAGFMRFSNEAIKQKITQLEGLKEVSILLAPLQELLNNRLKEEAIAVELANQAWLKYTLRKKEVSEMLSVEGVQKAELLTGLDSERLLTNDLDAAFTAHMNHKNAALKIIKLENRLKKEGIELTDKQTKATTTSTGAVDKATLSLGASATALAVLAIQGKATAKDVIAALLAMAIAFAIQKAFSSSQNPIIGAAIAAVASAAVLALFAAIPAFERGTSFSPGGAALVGERGPEIVNLPRGSSVTPNHMMGGLGGGVTINMSGFIGNPTELANQITVLLNNEQNNTSRLNFI